MTDLIIALYGPNIQLALTKLLFELLFYSVAALAGSWSHVQLFGKISKNFKILPTTIIVTIIMFMISPFIKTYIEDFRFIFGITYIIALYFHKVRMLLIEKNVVWLLFKYFIGRLHELLHTILEDADPDKKK
ncbi:MAG TPA: hypothetical protein P5140_08100 [Methanofastidiosum sp.]|nr:hypothetical protein [Methanofastidiosum sp.]